MGKKYTPEQFWKLYANLPQELKDALFAEETGDNIEAVCKKNGREDDLADIVDYVGQVLVGVLSPADFQNAIKQDLGVDQEIAKKISQEIYRLIFYPVKTSLESLYNLGDDSSNKPIMPAIVESPDREIQKGPDDYREPIE